MVNAMLIFLEKNNVVLVGIGDQLFLILEYDEAWEIMVYIRFFMAPDLTTPNNVKVQISMPNLTDVNQNYSCNVPECVLKFLLNREQISLWWPNGHGSQPLYPVIVTYFPDDKPFQIQIKDIGFRNLKLVQKAVNNKDASQGKTFYFEVNGRPIYCKGSNWIPASLIKSAITKEYIHHLLTLVKDANMNMLRIWGGGVYESDYFYELADRLGIMIWQDAMFAVALYPADPEFLLSVKNEISFQAGRLQHHPCVVVWSANNENEQALTSGWFPLYNRPMSALIEDYKNLYYKTVYETCKSIMDFGHDTENQFPQVLSSPSNGDLETSSINNSVSSNPGDLRFGDIHHYSYTGDLWNWNVYPKARFVSEYGYQAWPSYSSLLAVTKNPSKDLTFGSDFANYRQHHSFGNFQMLDQILIHFRNPNYTIKDNRVIDDSKSSDYFDKFTYLSQINQATAIKTQTEFYRRNRDLDETGLGLNMGALYWQLNDVWVAPTWSSIEYGGKSKILHHFAKSFFSHILLTIHFENVTQKEMISQNFDSNQNIDEIKIVYTVICDDEPPKDKYNLYVTLRNVQNLTIAYQKNISLSGVKFGSQVVLNQNLGDFRDYLNLSQFYFHAYIYNPGKPGILSQQRLFLNYPKTWKLNDPKISIVKVSKVKNKFTIHISTQNPAFYVWLEIVKSPQCNQIFNRDKTSYKNILKIGGKFSDNGFIMDTPELIIYYTLLNEHNSEYANDDSNLSNSNRCISVRTLYHIYQ
ncbi:beta-mannosidase-like isoform X2 [Gordionus sp. m RMFG-2023]|uniref:beta-mannosidase-like isoform X2 n=1 Tax=Gordionus sp. m RMFG-2023 TaxID=3053472 RepID=UPI0031FDCF2F